MPRNRFIILTRTRSPNLRQLLCYLAVLGILSFVALVPADRLHWTLDASLWQNHHLGKPIDITSAMIWLLAANATSFCAVFLLFRELRTLDKIARNQTFTVDASKVLQRFGMSENKAKYQMKRAEENPANWALGPLEWMYAVSVMVLLLTIIVTVVMVALHPVVPDWAFTVLVLWTIFVYLLAMMFADICACKAYRNVTCLRLQWASGTSDERKKNSIRDFNELVEALSDYERIFRYVDIPVLGSLALILAHKFIVLHNELGGYYLGFVAGTIAMHTILANIISIAIASSTTDAITEVTT